MSTCECGCEVEVKNRFKRGHWQKSMKGCHDIFTGVTVTITTKPKPCACGCGQTITPSAKHKYREPKYIRGHKPKTVGNYYKPHPSEIPSGLCECGCKKPTALAVKTIKTRRHFRGYPLPYLPHHQQFKRGREHHLWKGGRTYRHGYVFLYVPDDPRCDSKGYRLEHHVVWERANGRSLHSHETIHHINGIKDDNSINNLQLRSGRHGRGVSFQCVNCGSHNVIAVPI